MVEIFLSKALICFAATCYPMLYGDTTPLGTFQLIIRETADPGYGGDVLQFDETPTLVLAIHRLYLLNPKQKRPQRMLSNNPKDHKITNGCINVDSIVYESLKSCCSNSTVKIMS